MIKHRKGVEILTPRPSTTTARFREEDLDALCSQPGATGRALVKFRHTDGNIYDAAIGVNGSAEMLDPMDLVALPCPPICPGGKFSFTSDC